MIYFVFGHDIISYQRYLIIFYSVYCQLLQRQSIKQSIETFI